MAKLLASVTICGILVVGGCSSHVRSGLPPRNSNLTAGVVKRDIVKGTTTQAEILEIFGSPNVVTMNREQDEVWNYNRMSYDSASGADGGYAVLGKVFEASCMVSEMNKELCELRIMIQETQYGQSSAWSGTSKQGGKQIYTPEVYKSLFDNIFLEVKRREAINPTRSPETDEEAPDV